jgi:hypothetical protein
MTIPPEIMSRFVMQIVLVAGTLMGGTLAYFRKPISETIKLKKLIKLGYIRARLVKNDHTIKQIVTIPNKEGYVTFPGVEGIYIVDNASVNLLDGRYPELTWNENECLPFNYHTEYIKSKVNCPECKKEVVVNLQALKTPNPKVIDNLVLKVKSLASLPKLIKELQIIMFVALATLIVAGAAAFLVFKFRQDLVPTLKPVIENIVTTAISTAKTSVVA